ncbi:hypothetical protein [Clostridium magnum]|uniref:Uncharacterized protein n=1 Tax=Clostridium magnum DSM 2767 TaxID=1121326 RepID=A0A165RZN7_9CLOT|nr:hypothetical protein [Clostridium magnum]KZL91417.1 hypothetical protein CLMAG_31760 [Clostridium magnum DSM 2767]
MTVANSDKIQTDIGIPVIYVTGMTDCLYKYGINMLASTVVTDRNRVWN